MSATDKDEDFYFDFSHDLIGAGWDNHRHLVSRVAFLNHLRLDPTLNNLFQAIAKETGLADRHEAVDKAAIEFANILQIERHQLLARERWPKIRTKNGQAKCLAAGNKFIRAFEELNTALAEQSPTVAKRLSHDAFPMKR